MLDLQKMRQIVEGLHLAGVEQAFGQIGVESFNKVVETVSELYQRFDPALRERRLLVYAATDVQSASVVLAGATVLRLDSIGREFAGADIIQVLDNGNLALVADAAADAVTLSQQGVVYSFAAGVELIYAKGERFRLVNPLPTLHASVFSRPTYKSLEDALEIYRVRIAKDTSCIILMEAWDSANRICFRKKPEAKMRQSLYQFLNGHLQDAEVRPEQNNDESHPVDVKVSWLFSIQRAIVEIKWLGDSREEGAISTSYRPARANEGAAQLANYLDQSQTWGSNVRTRGYLVVFDGRRRNVSPNTQALSEADGFYYRDKEIEYDPDYSSVRQDFAPPVRFFMNPVLSVATA
jgi:hypothetical protein